MRLIDFFTPKMGPTGAMFIVGSGHSGTTLVASMFSARDDNFVPNRETTAFMRPKVAKAKWTRVQEKFEASGCTYIVEKDTAPCAPH